MNTRIRPLGLASLLGTAIACAGVAQATSPTDADASSRDSASAKREVPVARPVLDRSGKKRIGTASVYSHRFVGRKMADGSRMAADDDNAAHI